MRWSLPCGDWSAESAEAAEAVKEWEVALDSKDMQLLQDLTAFIPSQLAALRMAINNTIDTAGAAACA